MINRGEARLDVAKKLGADEIITIQKGDTIKQIMAHTKNGAGVDGTFIIIFINIQLPLKLLVYQNHLIFVRRSYVQEAALPTLEFTARQSHLTSRICGSRTSH